MAIKRWKISENFWNKNFITNLSDSSEWQVYHAKVIKTHRPDEYFTIFRSTRHFAAIGRKFETPNLRGMLSKTLKLIKKKYCNRKIIFYFYSIPLKALYYRAETTELY